MLLLHPGPGTKYKVNFFRRPQIIHRWKEKHVKNMEIKVLGDFVKNKIFLVMIKSKNVKT